MAELAETRLIQGRYRPLDLIGRGGMGEVWRARDESLGRQVAVKCLKAFGPDHDPNFARVLKERFRREARVAASLQHRGVTVVHDFGDDSAEGGALFLVMELLHGRNLSQLLDENEQRPLPVEEVLDIAEQVAAALAYTHEQGIVHRDLKPANIMRLTDGTVKICDFGIARLAHDIGFTAKLNGGGMAMGTPHYMSPEQIAGNEVDHRSDLYSLGCVLYEIATGAPPFDLGDSWSVLVGHRDTEPEPLRTHRPELPASFEAAVLDLLAKEPEARPRDARTLFFRLTDARTAEHGPARPHVPAAPAPLSAPPGPGTGRTHHTTGDLGAPTASGAVGGVPTAHAAYPAPTGHTAAPPTPVGPAAGTDPTTPAPPLPPWARALGHGPRVLPAGTRDSGAWARALTGVWTRPARPAPSGPPPRHAAGSGPARPADPRLSGPAGTAAATGPDPEARYAHGLALGRAGRWTEAVEAHREAAAGRAETLGPEHTATLAGRCALAFALVRAGRAADALIEYGRVAELRGTALGPEHPGTLAARQEMAYVLDRLGRHQEAYELYAQVLAIRERTAGPDHPDTLRCRHNLAHSLSGLGRPAEALATVTAVAADRARLLGPEDAETLTSRYEVAYLLGGLGRWEEALETYRSVAAARERTLGRDHPDTLAARYETGIGLGRLGRSAEALDLYRGLVRDRTRAYGAEDPETLRARHGLGVNLGRLARWEEAVAEARQVGGIRARVLGPDHPDTLVSRREVAVGLGWLGRWEEALSLYRAVAEARERTLGPGHPETLAAHGDEAHCLERLGRTAEAAALYRKVAAERGQGLPYGSAMPPVDV